MRREKKVGHGGRERELFNTKVPVWKERPAWTAWSCFFFMDDE